LHELPGLLQRGRRRDAAEIFAGPFMVAADQVFSLGMEDGHCDHHDHKQQRDDDGRYDPLGQTKLPQGNAPALCGGSARGPQSPVDAVGNAVMADPTLMSRE
jgi:hypothetical protein